MYVVFEIKGKNPKGLLSPYLESNRPGKIDNPQLKKKMDRVRAVLFDNDVNHEVKMGEKLGLLTSEPTIGIDDFLEIYQ